MVEEALCRYGWPEILSTDQGGRFTNDDLTGTLKDHRIMIAMDRKSLPSRRAAGVAWTTSSPSGCGEASV